MSAPTLILRKDELVQVRVVGHEWVAGRVVLASTNGESLAIQLAHTLDGAKGVGVHPEHGVVVLVSWVARDAGWCEIATGDALHVERLETLVI